MINEANVKLVKEFIQALASGDLDSIRVLLADDVIWNVAGSTNVSTVGLLNGKEQVLKWVVNFPENFKPLDFTFKDYFSNESDVLAVGRFRHLIKSTGRIVGSNMVMKFSVKSGEISRYEILEDSDLLNKAFDSNYNWDMQKIKINGNIYEYEDRGIGAPIIFGHGLFMDHTIFDSQIKLLETSFRCISFDMPGHGGSGYNKEGWTLDSLVDDLALFIEENDLKPVTYVGQSFGGTVGMMLAAKYPELVGKLILVGTTAHAEFNDRRENWNTMRQNILTASPSELEEIFKKVQEHTKSKVWLAKNQDKAEKERKIMQAHKVEGLSIAIDAVVLKRKDITHILNNIECLTTVVIGTDDTATPIELSYEIADKIPNSKLEIIKNAGHHLHIEDPEAFSNIMIEVMSR